MDDLVTWSTRGQWRYTLWKIMIGEQLTWFIIFFSFLACLAFLFLCIRRFRKGGLPGIRAWMWGGLTAMCLYGIFSAPARISYSLLAKVRAREDVYSSVYWRVQKPIIELIGALAYEGRKAPMDVPLLEDPLFTICLGLGIWTGIGCCMGWGIGFIMRRTLEREGSTYTKKLS